MWTFQNVRPCIIKYKHKHLPFLKTAYFKYTLLQLQSTYPSIWFQKLFPFCYFSSNVSLSVSLSFSVLTHSKLCIIFYVILIHFSLSLSFTVSLSFSFSFIDTTEHYRGVFTTKIMQNTWHRVEKVPIY